MNARQAAKLKTRQVILDAAKRTFERHGFEDATMRAIATAAHTSVGTLFAHFHDKFTLLHAILEDDILEAITQIQALHEPNLEQQLTALTGTFFRLWRSRPHLYKALWRHALVAQTDPAIAVRTQLLPLQRSLQLSFTLAKQQGTLHFGIDPLVATDACLALYHFTLTQWLQDSLPQGFTMERMFGRTLSPLLEGLKL